MPSDVRGAVVLNGSFVNAVNLPFPILQVIMGTYAYAATFAATTTALQVVVARLLQQRFGTAPEKGTRASVARAAPLVAIGAGVLLHYTAWPAAPSSDLLGWADLIENALIAAIFLHFGVALARSLSGPGKGFGLTSRPFLTTAAVRCVGGPVAAMLLAVPLGVGSAVYAQMVFVATMPPAIVNTLISRVYGFDSDSGAKWTTVLTPINTVEGVVLLLILGR
jgi:predicted permease